MVITPYCQEQLTDGLLYQKYQPHIHNLTFTDMSKQTVDRAFKLVTALDQQYAGQGNHIQYLYVLDEVSYTPYLLKKVLESIKLTPSDLYESTAVVTDTFLAKVLETLVLSKVSLQKKHQVRFFSTEPEAFAWFDERRDAIGK